MTSGFLDGFKGREAYGWASLDNGSAPLRISVTIDGEHVGQTTADQYREDLYRSGIQGGRAAFTFEIADRFCDGSAHQVEIFAGAEANALEGSPQAFTFLDEHDARREWCRRTIMLRSPDRDGLAESLSKTRKLAIFATYHRQAMHLHYHHHIIEALLDCDFTVLVVHATDDGSGVIDDIDQDDAFLLVKRNLGYDFGSFATGYIFLGDLLDVVDEVILINDSIVLIDLDLKPLLRRFRAAEADVVACTESFERSYHLQSYCLWLGPIAVHSTALKNFMTKYSFTSVKEHVIEEGEIGFSKTLQYAGLHLKALFDYPVTASLWLGEYKKNVEYLLSLPGHSSGPVASAANRDLDILNNVMRNVIAGIPTNPSHFFWDVLVDHFDFPFLKRELIVVNPCSVPTYAKIASYIAENPRVYAAVYGMIRIFGGTLVPALVADRRGDREIPIKPLGLVHPPAERASEQTSPQATIALATDRAMHA